MERFFSVLWNVQHTIHLQYSCRRSVKLVALRPLCTKIPKNTSTVIKATESQNTDYMDWLNLSHLSYEDENTTESVELLEKDNKINLRWDPASGQFSLTQGSQLERATEIVRDLAETNPDSVAIIWRKDNPASEEMVTYGQLNQMIEHVVDILEENDDKQAKKLSSNSESGTLIFLPVSILAVAVMLACASLQRPHSLVFAGFSSPALASLMESGQVGCIITSDHWPRLAKTLEGVMKEWPDIRTINLDVNCGIVSPSLVDQVNSEEYSLELSGNYGEDLSPLFALYTGGETSVIAGLKEEAGYYQVTSNVGLTAVEPLPEGDHGDGALCETPEQKFKEGKKKNTYRLAYINSMLAPK